jgi:hypothetical protein
MRSNTMKDKKTFDNKNTLTKDYGGKKKQNNLRMGKKGEDDLHTCGPI